MHDGLSGVGSRRWKTRAPAMYHRGRAATFTVSAIVRSREEADCRKAPKQAARVAIEGPP